MSESDELMQEIVRLDEEICDCQTERAKALQRWAELVCPHTVGDVVEIHGYSHRGKRGEVVKVSARQGFRGQYEWSVKVIVLKSDGTKGLLQASWNQSQEEPREQ